MSDNGAVERDAGPLLETVTASIGWSLDGLLKELEAIPAKVYSLRQRLAPLRAEMKMLEARFASRGRSPSHFDVERSLLLSELKEEARSRYELEPKFKETTRGKKTKIELTDGRAEDLAHSSLRYRKFLEEAWAEQRRIRELGKEAGVLHDRLEVWRGRREYLTQRIEMAKALVYAWNASSKL